MAPDSEIELSLVVPLYNEEDNVVPLVDACLGALGRCAVGHELILVDDGSTDGTLQAIRSAAAQHERIHAVSLRRRFGKGAALAAGFAESCGRRVATIDADLQEDPAELPALLAVLEEGVDLVTGWRNERRDSGWKKLQSSLFHRLVRLATGRTFRDLNCGFKVMRREVAQELVLTGGRFRLIPLVAEWWGYRTAEHPVAHRPRARGTSSFGGNRFPGALIDLIAVLCLIRYHSRPGHLFIQLGTVSGLGGAAICGYLAFLRLAHGSIGFRYPLLALGVLLVATGVELVATGFLGEWLSYTRRDANPGYRVGWRSRDESGRTG